jgi:hypothetical protein
MERQYIVENRKERERLCRLVDEITDHWSLLLMKKWKSQGMITPVPLDWDTYNYNLFPNDAPLPFLLMVPHRIAANMAVSFAEEIDRELEDTPPEMIAEIEHIGDKSRLYRSIHRKMHLDEIEAFLKARKL